MKRRKLVTLIGGLAIAWPLACYPQPPDDLIVRRLGQLGWIEGRTIAFECVSAFGRIDQVSALARELVSRRTDVLMA